MPIATDFNNKILSIWKKYLSIHGNSEIVVKAPALYPENHFPENLKLLMLGMNPSFGVNWVQKRISDEMILGPNNTHLTADLVYGWTPESGPNHLEHLLTIEEYAFNNFRIFFEPQLRFATSVGCADSYSHMDLFHVRQTSQHDFLTSIGRTGDLTNFGREQVELTRQTILEIKPKAVVIANATAAKLAVELMNLEYLKDSRAQCKLAGLNETRFFLAGMLSGGRAMDTFSRIRLEEDVRAYFAE
jgi:hypothetical protein